MSNSPNSSPLAADPKYSDLVELYRLRAVARIDPDVFVSLCFRGAAGHPVEQSRVHHELQQFLTDHPKALVELPRDHGKSFQVCCRVLWELGRTPDLRVKVVCATEAVAAERSRFLRAAIDHNAMLQDVFPNLKRGSPWAAEAFAVERAGDVIGPSVAAFGVGAGSTGTRADLLVCDDIVDVRALHSRADRERTAAYFHDNLMNLLEPDGRFWGLCTPWHPDDLNARLKANPSFALFRRAVGSDLEPVWPERWTRERLAERRAEIGAASFARGYHLLPVAERETPIRGEWVQFWAEERPADDVVLSVDPAVSAGAAADASALVVLARTGSEVRVLAASGRRVSAPELVNLIDEYDRLWHPSVILFETNAAFLGISDLLKRHARFGAKLKGVTQSRDKAARVAAFSVVVENGCVRLKGDAAGGADAGQRELLAEMTTFPFGEHDDLLDAAATGTAYLLDKREPRVWG